MKKIIIIIVLSTIPVFKLMTSVDLIWQFVAVSIWVIVSIIAIIINMLIESCKEYEKYYKEMDKYNYLD